jgi:hypothetical protein
VSRLRSALTPAAFFLGLALISSSLIEFSRWAYVHVRLIPDMDVDLERARTLDASFFFSALPLDARYAADCWMAGAALAGAAGVVLGLLRRRAAAAWTLGLSTLIGLVPAVVLGLEFSAFLQSRVRVGCGSDPSSFGPWLPPLLASAVTFALVMSVLAGVAWLIAQRQDGVPLTPYTWIALGVALAMMGVALVAAESARYAFSWDALKDLNPHRPTTTPGRMTAWIAALTILGLMISTRPLYVSRFVSVTMVLLGALMAVPAIAIVHDEHLAARIEHEAPADAWPRFQSIPGSTCEPFEPEASILVGSDALEVNHHTLNSQPPDLERELFSKIVKEQEKIQYIIERADLPAHELAWDVRISPDAQLDSTRLVLRTLKRAGVRRIALVHTRVENVQTWLQPMVHRHLCGVAVSLSDSGTPFDRFADSVALVRAADEAAGNLQLDAR